MNDWPISNPYYEPYGVDTCVCPLAWCSGVLVLHMMLLEGGYTDTCVYIWAVFTRTEAPGVLVQWMMFKWMITIWKYTIALFVRCWWISL